jgi:hypothetical protein
MFSKEFVESSLPALPTCQYHTTSDATPSLAYTGILQPWQGFAAAVHAAHQNQRWRKRTLGYMLGTGDPYTFGNVEVGDEHGVQSRFHKYVGDVMNTVFETHSINLGFADFKCIPSNYLGIPDVVMRTSTRDCKVVGEFKAPWIASHRIEPLLSKKKDLRVLLAQTIRYMQRLDCAYGFLSNYEETIFLRQVVDTNGVWRIEHSQVVLSTTKYETNPLAVSVRQCFFYVGCQAVNHGPVNNTTQNWVVME